MNNLSRFFLLLLLSCSVAFAQDRANEGFRSLHVDAGKVIGEIRSFQGVNGQPTPVMAGLPNLVRQYKELRINLVRTHDFMGPTEIDSKFEYDKLIALIPNPAQCAGVVETGNKSIIFPNESANPENPASYNFGPTDKVLAAIHATGAGIYYRVGRSWGANSAPPVDFDKYASVVKHIAMHYNQGWANGFHYHIRYWEFWNEPDDKGGLFWSGTPQQFYSLYAKVARALKSVDPTLKVGGDALADPNRPGPYREGFLNYCAAHKVPLDFFSWHEYSADPYDAVRSARTIRAILDAHGFPRAESILSEWNSSANFTAAKKAELESARNAAYIGAALSYFQNAPIDHAMFYRGDAAWMGLFDLQGKYFKTAYAFKAMGQMMETPLRLAVEGTDTRGFAALAGRSQDGKTVQVFISNYVIPAKFAHTTVDAPAQPPASAGKPSQGMPPRRTNTAHRDNAGYNLVVNNLPWGNKAYTVKRYRISKTQNLELVEDKSGSGGSFKLTTSFPAGTVDLIVLERK